MGKYLIMMNIFLKFLKYLNIEQCVGAQVEEDTGPGTYMYCCIALNPLTRFICTY
jgi:hypothetical protein